ncbi:MAG: ADP-ribose pyrophosphatase [Desulfuromonas sp.]|nr:MAG: ADP-ribose pyrophosphatase [Desulfuromonas sp.]
MSKINEEEIYHGRIFDVVREVHRMPDGREARFEIIKHPGGAAALPVLADGRLLLIRQFRPVTEEFIYEIPAGRLEPEEDAGQCIARELEEEIGYTPGAVESLGFVWSSVGFCSEKIHLFLARDLQPAQLALEPDEFIEPEILTLAEALEMIASGRINDAKTQIALLRYAQTRKE